MAAVVEMREPLSLLHRENSQNMGRRLLEPTKPAQQLGPQKKVVRKSAPLLNASKDVFAANVESMKPSILAERFVLRESTNSELTASPKSMAEDGLPVVVFSRSQSLPMAEPRQTDTSLVTSIATRDQSSGSNQIVDQAAEKDERESNSLMQLKMEAMTWAAMAKDDTIWSLERRLRTALEIAKAEQDRNQQLDRMLHESRVLQEATAQELKDAKEEIVQLIDVEERLCMQLGNFEVEAVEEDRNYQSQIRALAERIEEQDRFIADSFKQLKAAETELQQSDHFKAQGSEHPQSLAEKLDMAKKEIAALQADLSYARTDVRRSEVQRRNESRRLKALQKERRHLMKKGACRPVRSAPRAQKMCEKDPPGGAGWKVFSILEFEV